MERYYTGIKRMTPSPSDSEAKIPLSAEERAEKILHMLSNAYFDINQTLYRDAITDQIKQAEKSIFERTRERAAEICHDRIREFGAGAQSCEHAIKNIHMEDL